MRHFFLMLLGMMMMIIVCWERTTSDGTDTGHQQTESDAGARATCIESGGDRDTFVRRWEVASSDNHNAALCDSATHC